MTNIDDSRIHEGHRQRMKNKLLSHGSSIFDTYELLEMLLYNVIPYKDTNPIAKRLLLTFGSLEGVLSAGKEELCSVVGVGERVAEYLVSVGSLGELIGSELLSGPDVKYDDYDSVGIFLASYFDGRPDLRVVALSFDNDMRLIGIDDIALQNGFSSGGSKPSTFIEIALSRRASVMITAQNNYYGAAYPTPGDRATAVMVSESLSSVDVTHLEHYLVSGKRYIGASNVASYRFSGNGVLEKFDESRRHALSSLEEEKGGTR